MEKFGKSQSVTRVEDARFVTGHGRYIDDVAPEGARFAYFLRSPVAHAEITGLDFEAARAAPGVHLVAGSAEMEAAGIEIGMAAALATNRDGSKGAAPLRPVLAKGRVRFVGEAVAVVVADTLAQARDAAELIGFDYEELPAHVALATGGPQIHDEAPDNLAYDYLLGDAEKVEAAFAAAAHVVEREIGDNRIIAASMEPRGCYAEWDGARLHVAYSGQGVWDFRDELARCFKLEKEAVRVSTPDVGGGFGMKGQDYPEHFVIAYCARALGQPVRWMSDRSEAMLSDNGGRDLVSTAALAFDADGRILGYRIHNVSNLGAYNSGFAQNIQSRLFSRVLTGTYDIPAALLTVEGIYTNTTPVDAYRGAGRPEAIYALERLMDYAADALGVDPWELRRRNFIPAEAFPYRTVPGEIYDVGEFHALLDMAEAVCDRAGFAARRKASAAEGKLRGLGLSFYIESILGLPHEDAKVSFHDDGTASIFVGTQSNGQGHETVYAQFLSDQTGIPADRIHVIQGDSDLIATGGGTGGSRSVTVQTLATLAVVDKMVAAFTPFLAGEMGVDEADISFDDERFRAEGSNLTPSLLEAAQMARAAGRADLLVHEARAKLPGRSFPNGAHVAEVEIDPATGVTRVVRYTVVDDFGNLINPMLAEGQVHGGVVQGIGQALTEHVVYDEDGQLLTASFMDYGMPRAEDVPQIDFYTRPVPSIMNPMGMKGCGEAGTVGALAAVSNAVLDAVRAQGIDRVDMPFTPMRVWSLLQSGTRDAA